MPISHFFIFYIQSFMHWGYVCRVVPFSKSRMTLKAPPPTTLIGALSYPLARLLGWSEVIESKPLISSADKLRKIVVSAHAKLDFAFVQSFDLNRVYWYHTAKKEVKTDAVALGKTYVFPSNNKFPPKMDIAYVVNGKTAEEELGENWKNIFLSAGWGITRIGQKESNITVSHVSLHKAETIHDGELETTYYFPAKASSTIIEGSCLFENFVDLSFPIGDYSAALREPFVIPYSTIEFKPVPVRLKLSNEGIAVCSDHLTLVTLKRWLGI